MRDAHTESAIILLPPKVVEHLLYITCTVWLIVAPVGSILLATIGLIKNFRIRNLFKNEQVVVEGGLQRELQLRSWLPL
jgi:hypothetical protein